MSNPTLSTTDQARLAVTCQDKAHTYHGGVFGFGQDSTTRYVADFLHNKTHAAYPFAEVRSAVSDYLTSHSEVLTYTDERVKQNQQDRADASEAAASKAYSLWLAGFPNTAVTVLDEAEALNPDHRVDDRYSWDMLRNVINTQGPES